MRKNTVPVWGIAILIVGVLTLFDTFGFFEVGFWFWVAICLIVPCFLGLFRRGRNKVRYLCGLTIGVLLLLYNFDIIGGRMVFPGCIAMLLIIWGIRLIAGDSRSGNTKIARENENQNDFGKNGGYYYGKYNKGRSDENTSYESYNERYVRSTSSDGGYGRNAGGASPDTDARCGREANGAYSEANGGKVDYSASSGSKNGWYSNQSGRNSGKSIYDDDYGRATYNRPNDDNEFRQYRINLDGREIVYRNEPFHGIGLKANLGSVVINLRDAIITKDTNIDVKAVMSGVEILVPRNINVVVVGKPLLGGIDNNTVPLRKGNTFATIYVKADCILSGIDINY